MAEIVIATEKAGLKADLAARQGRWGD